MSVALRHPVTGQIKIHEQGWSWACFFGAGVLGLPLFKRGLHVWGAAMLVLDLTTLIVGLISAAPAASLYGWMSAVTLGASVFFGLKANAMATDHALLHGWEIADPRRDWFR